MAILDRGRIQQIGAPREVYLRPASRFVAGFIGETNLLSARVANRDGASVELLTPLGTLTSTALPAEPLAAGDEVTLSIRPESIVLDVPGAASNAFPAVFRDSVYLGEIAQHHIAAGPAASPQADGTGTVPPAGGAALPPDGTVLKVFELNPRFAGRTDQLQRTTARVDPKDVVVLTR